MNRLKTIIAKRWSIFFALIPGLNVIYCIIIYLFAQTKRTFYIWAIPAALIPCALLATLLSQLVAPLSGYFFGYLFFTVLALIQYFKCRGCILGADRRLWIRALVVALPILAILVTFTIVNNTRKNLENTVETIMETTISKDELAWYDLLHPKCDGGISSIKRLYQTLHESGIQLSGAVEDVQIQSFSKSAENGETNTYLSALVTVGGISYLIDLWIYKDWEYEGLRSLSIKQAYS